MRDEETTTDIVVRSDSDVELRQFEQNLLGFLDSRGLPSQAIFVPVEERIAVFQNIQNVIAKIDRSQRERSVYVSKFVAAVATGLFDAALNYLWNETIFELRRRVAQYDLPYFYDNAVANPEKRKRLNSEEDLERVDDSELIQGAKAIGLISDLGFKHLDYIRYMRNWASAAHPNQNELTGLQLVSWLETCIKEVMSLPLSRIAIDIRKLLENIRAGEISEVQANQIAEFFLTLTAEQVSKLALGFFGMYTRVETTSQTRQNIRLLLPHLWDRVDEQTRQDLGIKRARLVINGQQDEDKLARQFLESVSATHYTPDTIRAGEIKAAIEDLLSAHRNFNNFYNEPAFARELQRLVGERGEVPSQVNKPYVLALVEVFLTNGNGVAWNAEPIYASLIRLFDTKQALMAILSFDDENIASRLQFELCQQKYRELLTMMKVRVSAPAVKETIEKIEGFTGPLDKLRDDSRIKGAVRNLRKIIDQQGFA